jgi:hypothetical protein
MSHSLINLNQLWHHGIVVHNNPYDTDPTKTMGIEVNDDDLIPFLSQGSMIFFNTRYPNDNELDMYPYIVIMSDKPWDPHGLIMPGGFDDMAFTTMTT